MKKFLSTKISALFEKVKLLQDIRTAEKQIAAGKGVGHKTAKIQILKNLK